MSDLAIVNGIWNELANDAIFLSYFGLTPDSPVDSKAARIQKELEADGLTADNMPVASIYPILGKKDKINDLVYDAMFELAIYSTSSSDYPDESTKAGTMLIGQRAMELLHQLDLSGATFLTEFDTSFQSPSDIAGIKKYVMRFKVSEVIK